MSNFEDIFTDCSNILKTNMNFIKNKDIAFHRWYPFVEGFSEEFINGIVNELDFESIRCLEPFAGSGTTPLTLQRRNIECASYEVNPFMYLLTRSKLTTDYTVKGLKRVIEKMNGDVELSKNSQKKLIAPPIMSSMIDNGKRKKWLFHNDTMNGLLHIKYAISRIDDKKYINLSKVVLASILLKVSNVYRNGKCVSYKEKWKDKIVEVDDVINMFFERYENVVLNDIKNYYMSEESLFSNFNECILGDVLKKIDLQSRTDYNLVITSPPYLNSRDYTDSYMVELWMLDLVKSYDDVRKLRNKTIKSHVQVKWDQNNILNITKLKTAYNEILNHKDDFWNISIPSMITGYFNDMNTLFEKFNQHMVPGGKIYFNVANSAYYGTLIPTDEIIAEIAENNNYDINEIRIARKIKPSSQQKENIDHLRESVIVMTKQ